MILFNLIYLYLKFILSDSEDSNLEKNRHNEIYNLNYYLNNYFVNSEKKEFSDEIKSIHSN